jgi:hypothetical protein
MGRSGVVLNGNNEGLRRKNEICGALTARIPVALTRRPWA